MRRRPPRQLDRGSDCAPHRRRGFLDLVLDGFGRLRGDPTEPFGTDPCQGPGSCSVARGRQQRAADGVLLPERLDRRRGQRTARSKTQNAGATERRAAQGDPPSLVGVLAGSAAAPLPEHLRMPASAHCPSQRLAFNPPPLPVVWSSQGSQGSEYPGDAGLNGRSRLLRRHRPLQARQTEVARYCESAEAALDQFDWCIGYLRRIRKSPGAERRLPPPRVRALPLGARGSWSRGARRSGG